MSKKQMPWVIPVSCEGCGDCVNKCPKHVLEMTPTNVEGIFVPWMVDTDLCGGCGLCAGACVMGGIVMTEYIEQATERFLSKKPTVAK